MKIKRIIDKQNKGVIVHFYAIFDSNDPIPSDYYNKTVDVSHALNILGVSQSIDTLRGISINVSNNSQSAQADELECYITAPNITDEVSYNRAKSKIETITKDLIQVFRKAVSNKISADRYARDIINEFDNIACIEV